MTQFEENSALPADSSDWQARLMNWLTTLDQPTLDALRDSIPADAVDGALAALAPEAGAAPDRPALLRNLLRFYIAHDHDRREAAADALEILRQSNLPRSTLALFAASLALKSGDETAAWASVEPLTTANSAPDGRLVDLWYRLSANHLEEAQRHATFARWVRFSDRLKGNAQAWQRLGALALNLGDLIGAMRAFRQGIKTWVTKPIHVPPKPKTSVIADAPATTAQLLSLLARIRAAGLTTFPIAGTLLGLEREGQLLAGDKDADLACPADQIKPLHAWLESAGWQFMERKPRFANYFSYRHPQWPIALDLFAHYPDPKGGVLSGWWVEGGNRQQGRFTHFPAYTLTARQTEQGEITYPTDPGQLLTASYGDWQTPDPLFDTVVMAHNLVARTPMVASYAYAHLLTSLLEGKVAKARRYAQWLAESDKEIADQVLKQLEAPLAT
jgi:hypothetical protein